MMEAGYYWVKIHELSPWMIARYALATKAFYMYGFDNEGFTASHFHEIGPRIPEPETSE